MEKMKNRVLGSLYEQWGIDLFLLVTAGTLFGLLGLFSPTSYITRRLIAHRWGVRFPMTQEHAVSLESTSRMADAVR